MRPIRLQIEGLTSFRQKVEIDFSSFDLFAITGPTGAGKTSIIDAIIYALYGRTPRLGTRSVRELISQGANRLTVLLEFSCGTTRYRIARELQRKPRRTEVRLEMTEGDRWVSLGDRAGDAEQFIEQTIGLDYKGFTKAVVLPHEAAVRSPISAQNRAIFRPLWPICICERSGTPACAETKKFKMVHKPQTSATGSLT